MSKQLWIMSGVMASGKSKYAKDHILNEKTAYISRDLIRFNLLKDDEDYFTHEKKTYQLFVELVQNNLDNENIEVVIADATFLTDKSRKKFLNKLKLKDDTGVKLIIMDTSLYTCLARNEDRKGRKYVPEDVIIDAWEKFERTTGIERINESVVADGEDRCDVV